MDYSFLTKTLLFQGMEETDVKDMLGCLNAREKNYSKGEVIFRMGDSAACMGMVLSGRISIENDDLWGRHSVLDSVEPGMVFAETYACLPGEPMMVSAAAAEASRILFLDAGRMENICPRACACHSLLIRNLLRLLAHKNLSLSRRMLHTSSKSIRGRLLSYLSFQASMQGRRDFTIPFNRQQLADYLGVDRSAMSAELGKMQREGLLVTRRNHFHLIQKGEDFHEL